MIGLGLSDENDISIRGLETVRKCDIIYLESYTSKLHCNIPKMENLYGKKIRIVERDFVENKSNEIIEKARKNEIAFLVAGDPMCATTHIDFRIRAREKGVDTVVIHNASIVNAVGEIGLEVYKYGKITSIPFVNNEVKSPVDVFKTNMKNGMHTLFLLDLDPLNNKFMNIKEAADYLISKGVDANFRAIGCARIGSEDSIIRVSELRNLGALSYGEPPYCIVIPAKMHFMEEEALQLWKD